MGDARPSTEPNTQGNPEEKDQGKQDITQPVAQALDAPGNAGQSGVRGIVPGSEEAQENTSHDRHQGQ